MTPWTATCQAPPSMEFFQARILKWVTIPFSRRSSHPGDWTQSLALQTDSLLFESLILGNFEWQKALPISNTCVFALELRIPAMIYLLSFSLSISFYCHIISFLIFIFTLSFHFKVNKNNTKCLHLYHT